MEFHSSAPGLLSCHGEKFVCSELKENGRRLTIWPTTICKSAFFGSCTHLNFGAISECMEATVTAMFIFHMHIIHMLHLHLASCTSLSRVLYVWLLQYSEYLSRSYTAVKVLVLEYPWNPTCLALVFLGSTIRTSDFGRRTSKYAMLIPVRILATFFHTEYKVLSTVYSMRNDDFGWSLQDSNRVLPARGGTQNVCSVVWLRSATRATCPPVL